MIPADLGDLASLALCAPAADGTWTAIHDVDATLVGGIGKSVQADAVAATDAVLEYGDSTLILSDRFGGLFSMQALAGGATPSGPTTPPRCGRPRRDRRGARSRAGELSKPIPDPMQPNRVPEASKEV
ncbi:hypothetical protein G7085_07945 [Tessaracoccus sp. HDW20]|uniref:hypothetical protein n=1 Tax=Tessaracoccus coleopterorum TaxID=2714950 RepID=UPI0018D435C4|nr:hypothetical protein [Tessaracoccus coleopterorum]NHB84565.1 hypothetical protein [Tessaracoccus coleopterorum]